MSSDSNPKVRTMIVEDHQIYRIGLRVMIETDPAVEIIAEASDGQKAITVAQQMRPDVIIMDLSMPSMGGVESTKCIKELIPDTKILILTSHDDDERVFSALSAGADGYCLKDTSAELICAAIKAVNCGVGWLDPVIAKKVLLASSRSSSRAPHAPHASNSFVATEHAKFGLTARQAEILECVVKGMSNIQIAEALNLSADTVKTHMHNIMDKLAVSDRTQAAVKALKSGIVRFDVESD